MSEHIHRWVSSPNDNVYCVEGYGHWMTVDLANKYEVFKAYVEHLSTAVPVENESYEIWWSELQRLDAACRSALDARDAAADRPGEGD